MKNIQKFKEHNDYKTFYNEYSELIFDILSNSDDYLSDKELEKYYFEIKNDIINNYKNSHIFRKISISDKELINFKNSNLISTGIYWSFNQNLVKNWKPFDSYDDRFLNKEGKNEIIFESKIDFNIVNFNETIKNHFISTEEEVTLLPNKPIIIKNIFLKNKKLDISSKKFTT